MLNAAGNLQAIGQALAGVANPQLLSSIQAMVIQCQALNIPLGVTNQQLAQLGININMMKTPLQSAVEQMQKLQQVMTIGAATIARVTQSVQGMAAAGLRGTLEGMRLGYAWELLSRQIGAIFLPIINAATNAIISLRNSLASLTGSGQNVLMVLVSITGGLVTMLTGMIPLKSALVALGAILSPARILFGVISGAILSILASAQGATLLGTLAKAIGSVVNLLGSILAPIFTILSPLINVATWALGLFADMIDWVAKKAKKAADWVMEGGFNEGILTSKVNKLLGIGQNKVGGNGNDRRDVTPGKISFEGIGDAMERITLAANKSAAMDIQEKQLAEQEKTNMILDGVKGAVENIRPVAVR